ncbi:hypothetical protein D3C87_1692720 [compost metagenome]
MTPKIAKKTIPNPKITTTQSSAKENDFEDDMKIGFNIEISNLEILSLWATTKRKSYQIKKPWYKDRGFQTYNHMLNLKTIFISIDQFLGNTLTRIFHIIRF